MHMNSRGARRVGPVVVAGVALLALAGCGSRTAPVRGKVAFADGTPLAGGWVVFEPAEGDGPGADGEVQPDGTFRLSTFKPGDGAVPGRYRAVVKPPPVPEEKARAAPPAVDPRYGAFATSGLEYTVPPAGADLTITVHKPGPPPGR